MRRIISHGLLIIIGAFVLGGCQKSEVGPPPVDLSDQLIGTWETTFIHVDVVSAEGKDSMYVFEIDEQTWMNRMQVKPLRTLFNPDNSYRVQYPALNDSLLSEERGLWQLYGDTLHLIQPDATYIYEIALSNGQATFHATLDWDGDGEDDDNYRNKRRKISAAY